MLRSEFTELTKQYVTANHYAEIEKRYYESGLDKVAFCKAFKANKNGMAEAAARDASIKEWKQADEIEKEWKQKYDELRHNFDTRTEFYQTRMKARNEENEKLKADLAKALHKIESMQEADRLADEKSLNVDAVLRDKEREILELKAKLYDLMSK